MTAPYTPANVNIIRKNAGKVPAAMIAEALGWPMDRLRRIAATHGLDLEIPIDAVAPAPLRPGPERAPPPDRRSCHFSANLRPADAKILRDKAEQRFTNPSRLLAEVFEGAIARGKVDELATAATTYRPQLSPDAGGE